MLAGRVGQNKVHHTREGDVGAPIVTLMKPNSRYMRESQCHVAQSIGVVRRHGRDLGAGRGALLGA